MSVLKQNNNIILATDNKILSNTQNGAGGVYYSRYPENGNMRFYANSIYLKDAIIDVNNKVEKVWSSLKTNNDIGVNNVTPYFYQSTLANRPEKTESGFKFDSARNDYLRTTNDDSGGLPLNRYWFDYFSSLEDFFMGFWHMPLSNKSNQHIFGLGPWSTLGVWMRIVYNAQQNPGNKYLFSDGSTLLNVAQDYPLNWYNHIALIKKGKIWKYFVNGVYVGTTTHTQGEGTTWWKITMGNTLETNTAYPSDCLMDDIFFERNVISVDPTGYAIGDKVFEPPRRGGFNSDFKIFPIP